MSEQQPNAENEFETMLQEVLARKDEEIARLEALLAQASEQLEETPVASGAEPIAASVPAHAPESAPSPIVEVEAVPEPEAAATQEPLPTQQHQVDRAQALQADASEARQAPVPTPQPEAEAYDPILATRSLSEPVQIVLDARKPGI